MEEDQESKHVCKFCGKSFPCGRSLGGHMRSHIASNNNSAETEEKLSCVVKENGEGGTNSGYGLREKRKKTWRVTDSSDEALLLNKFCKQCGKGFCSWKALFGHMKCHSEKERASINDNNSVEDHDSWNIVDSQSDNEAPDRRRRTRSKRTRTTTSSLSFPNPSSSVSEIEQEQEEVAMSLMMLSRDMGPWGFQEMGSEKKGKRSELSASGQSPRSGVRVNKTRKLEFQSAMAGSEEDDEEQGKKNYKFLGSELNSNPSKNSHKRGKFECTTCNKIFHSYQALGGHRASHKRITKGCFASIEESSENTIETDLSHSHQEVVSGFDLHEEPESKKSKGHECPICLKVFPSGQALGGHKRCHLAGGSESQKDQSTVLIQEPVQEVRDLIDLNLPVADATEEENNKNCHSESYRSPWWVRGSHKQEALVGLMSN